MTVKIELTAQFFCSIERAFKAPILGDATKFLNGYLFQPPVIGFEEDETWATVGGFRYPITNGNFWMPKGRIFTDKILVKEINKIWRWTIYDFQVPFMFFAKRAIGEWEVKGCENNKVCVRYCYTFYSKNVFYHFFTIFFGLVQWRGMMKKAINGIKRQAESNDKFVYENQVDIS